MQLLNYTKSTGYIRSKKEIDNENRINVKKIIQYSVSKKMDLYERYDSNDWQLDPQDKKKVKTFVKDKSLAYQKICYNSTCDTIKLKEKYGYQLNKIKKKKKKKKKKIKKENNDGNEKSERNIFKYAQK